MIDHARLEEAYRRDGVYALQLEVGDECHQGCIYCYMNALPVRKNALSDHLIREILDDAHKMGVTAIEWLGGEPLLRPSVFDHMAHAAELGMRNNVWTGGLPLADPEIRTRTAQLSRHGLIAVHVSSVDPDTYRRLHPDRPVDDLRAILDAVRQLIREGYPQEQVLNSVTFTGLQSADDQIRTIDYFENEFGMKTCVNVFHTYARPETGREDLERFVPSPRDVSIVYKRYARQYGVAEFPMNCVNKQYCSATIAVLNDGTVTPCATIRESDAPKVSRDGTLSEIFQQNRSHLIFSHFKHSEHLPEECRCCDLESECWGCRSRAYAAGMGIYGKDPRCFRSRQVKAEPSTKSRQYN
jgi:radical SAM protein with 4Fe4S-binding SPASM domain